MCAVAIVLSQMPAQARQTGKKPSEPAQAAPEPIIAIKAGKLLNPETGKTEANQIILVQGKLIKEIGGKVAIPADAQVVDLSKSTVLPGLFDAHTHLCMMVIPERDNGNYYFTTLLDTTAYRAVEGVGNGHQSPPTARWTRHGWSGLSPPVR